MSAPVLVFGSTGTVGGELVGQLLRNGQRVRGATRNPAEAARRFGPAAEFVEFDFLRPETHATALAGVERAFLMARPGDEHSDRLAIPLIDQMRRHGVRHVVDLSALGAEQRDEFALRRIERHLEASGMAFTHLRPNWFMQIFTSGALCAGIRAGSVIALPAADAKISYIDARDIAAVAAEVLTTEGHAGKAYTLTGPEPLDHGEIASAISQVTGRMVRYLPIGDDDARTAMLAAGFSSEQAERLAGFYRLVRAGVCSPVSGDAERVLGRRPFEFRRFAADYAPCWAETPRGATG